MEYVTRFADHVDCPICHAVMFDAAAHAAWHAQIAASVPAEQPAAGSAGRGVSGGLGERLRALVAGPHPDVLLVRTAEAEWLGIVEEVERLEAEVNSLEQAKDQWRDSANVAEAELREASRVIVRVRELATQTGPNLSCAGHNVGDDGCFVAGLAQRVLAALDEPKRATGGPITGKHPLLGLPEGGCEYLVPLADSTIRASSETPRIGRGVE